jgi:hypothetical protein
LAVTVQGSALTLCALQAHVGINGALAVRASDLTGKANFTRANLCLINTFLNFGIETKSIL